MVLKAVFDGQVFRPTGPLPASLKPGAEVDIQTPTDDDVPRVIGEPGSFLRVASEANLQGPPDWSRNLEKYANGGPDV